MTAFLGDGDADVDRTKRARLGSRRPLLPVQTQSLRRSLAGLVCVCALLLAGNLLLTRVVSEGALFRDMRAANDKARGIYTDNIVGVLTALATALLLRMRPSVELSHVSMAVFAVQEIVNFTCDNALRSTHLKYYFYRELLPIARIDASEAALTSEATPALRVTLGARAIDPCPARDSLLDGETLDAVDASGAVVAQVQVRTIAATIAASRGRRASSVPLARFGTAVDVLVVSPSLVDSIDAAREMRAATHLRLRRQPTLSASLGALQYFALPIGTRSAIISVLTVFLLDATSGAIDEFVLPVATALPEAAARYLPVLSMWLASVLASVPVNVLRFDWAYRDTKPDVSDGVVCLAFLLMSAVYMRLHRDGGDDEANFPKRSKATLALLGLVIVVFYTALPLPTFPCPLPNLSSLGQALSSAPALAQAIVWLTVSLSALLISSSYAYTIHTQLHRRHRLGLSRVSPL